MLKTPPESEVGPERHFTPEMLPKVVDLASRLQEQHQETLTPQDLETIAAEVGLEPTFVRQALAQLAAEQVQTTREKGRKKEFRSLVAALVLPLLWGTLAYLFRYQPGVNTFFTLVAAWPLAVLLGFLSGRRAVGLLAAAELFLALAPTFEQLPMDFTGIGYTLLLGPIAALLGWGGASIREEYFPLRMAEPTASYNVSRSALLNLLFALQGQLDNQKQHRAFLSVDVVGSSEMKRTAPELAVEYSFGQYRQWVEEVVRIHGGEMQSAAGDGVMGMFTEDAAAVRAAHQLQQELPQFNATRNRLSRPFRIRCGVSAGEVAIEEGIPLGHLQSPVIDRAAVLQKRAEPGDIVVSEEVAAALTEWGSTTRLAEPVEGETAFSWQEEQRMLDARRG